MGEPAELLPEDLWTKERYTLRSDLVGDFDEVTRWTTTRRTVVEVLA